ncbi:MAG: 16S rRNA (guanine(966)-N(2))-methyltransferase RsmD [Candidatus Glassbacteria bacterium]
MPTRIIAGEFRSRTLKVPRGHGTRPTLARLKESLFSFLGPDVENKMVCDLFAGSGSLGFEALSRGARKVFFVERNAAALTCLSQNISDLGLEERAELVQDDVFRFLKRCSCNRISFDIMLADPDYRSGDVAKLIKFLDSEPLLTSILCLEHERSEPPSPDLRCGDLIRTLASGEKRISVYAFGGEK